MSDIRSLSDEELMIKIGKGSEPAFDELYNRYSRKALAFFYRMYNNDEEKAQDALQDIFMKIAEKPGLFDTGKKFSPWFFSIAYNMCKNEYKRSTIKRTAHAEIKHTGSAHDESLFKNISGRMDAKLFRNSLHERLSELSDDKRAAFLLKYQDNKSIKEIAEIQECSEGTVKSRLFYTIKYLAAELAAFDPKN
jgi:RNA polymerase sigma-70 factor (ECF subfamily)